MWDQRSIISPSVDHECDLHSIPHANEILALTDEDVIHARSFAVATHRYIGRVYHDALRSRRLRDGSSLYDSMMRQMASAMPT